ncbi:hypothetical protein [Flammeovirga sp. SJP92]|uniref:hypothetical protein n=1 Tax=Flammeovirga sp. SJP92 TaxID=1775430 RepID=UPI0007875697|nr:hypothetical protein [Flammeovirga sp. SJP92]KXX70644.1 hypothetical protein AVL50_07425 [Flammeovirga sp. SJP92]
MKTIVQITALLLLVSSTLFAQKRYLSDEVMNDSEKIAEEIAEQIYKTEPDTYLESISLVSFDEIEEDYFSVYQEVSEYLIDEDAYEVVVLLEETIETRYYNATGHIFLTVEEHTETTFPMEILQNYAKVAPACEVTKMTMIKPFALDKQEVYKVTLKQEDQTKVAYYKKMEEEFSEIRFKDISLLQK